MDNFELFTKKDKKTYTSPRSGETRFGESLKVVSNFDEIKNHPAHYIIFGIPEDIGIRGNLGKPGASTTWDSFLQAFLNIQVNRFNTPENCLVLGHVDCKILMEEAQKIMKIPKNPAKNLGPVVEKIDKIVSKIIHELILAGKTPIIVGGGHNNAFGNIKGTSQALGKAVNILNIDAHTDLRRKDYRHSGNGFSFAKDQGFIANYAVFGLHKNYTPEYIFEKYEAEDQVDFTFYEDLIGKPVFEKLIHFASTADILENTFGLEIDCDAIQGFQSSAQTPSGLSIEEIRGCIRTARTQDVHYLHLCEAAAQGNSQIGKALSFFVSDFMREEEED